jgi:predicted MFS family arabinose efflux permease
MPTFFELQGRAVLEFLSGIWSGGISGNLGAAAITCLVYLLGVPSQYLGGRVGERFELRRAYLLYHALSIPAALLTLWVTGAPVLILVMVYMFFLLGMQPIENTLVSRFTPANLRHAAFGAKFIFTFGVGSAAVWVVGWIQGAWGLQYVFPALGLVSAALVSVILVLIRVSNAENAASS